MIFGIPFIAFYTFEITFQKKLLNIRWGKPTASLFVEKSRPKLGFNWKASRI